MTPAGMIGRWFAVWLGASLAIFTLVAGAVVFLQHDRLVARLLESEGTIVRERVDIARTRGESLPAIANEIRSRLSAAGLLFAVYDDTGAFVAGDPRIERQARPWSPGAWLSFRQLYLITVPGGRITVATDPAGAFVNRLWIFALALLAIAIVAAAWVTAPRYVRRALEPYERTLEDRRIAGEERMRRLLADAGHELRTPLAVIRGYFSVIQRGAIFEPALLERILGVMESEVDRLQGLVDGLLRLARLESGVPLTSAIARADCAQAVAAAVARVGAHAGERLSVACEAGLPDVTAESSALAEALGNVLDNALKYAPEAHVGIAATRVAGGVEIVIDDAGPGMSQEDRDHAFARFYRGDIADRPPGAGLGLPIARGIVERAGGSIELRSAPGAGTSVRIVLPAASER
jgi:signal transduction histidine kinase